jgi:hypothetical protein
MWASAELNSTAGDAEMGSGCGSVVLLDSAGVTGGLSGGPGAGGSLGPPDLKNGAMELAQSRLLSFLLLTSNRIVLNARRQPTKALLERLVTASLAAIRVRPPDLPLSPTSQLEASAESWSAASALAPPSPADASADATGDVNACVAELPDPAASDGGGGDGNVGGGRAEMVMLLRDAQFSLTEGSGKELSERQVVDRWLPGSAGQLVNAAIHSWRLKQLPAPGPDELDQLQQRTSQRDSGATGDERPAGGRATVGGDGSGWVAKLDDLARGLTSGMRGGGWEGSEVADGAVLATWMERIVGLLNAPGAGAGGVQ